MASRKVLIGGHILGPLAREAPLSVSPKRRYHVDVNVDLLGFKNPRGLKFMEVIRRIAADTGVQVQSVQAHRFDVVPKNSNDLSTETVDAFKRRLQAATNRLMAALENG